MAALSDMKHEWRLFKADAPGSRFENHRRRMERHSRAHHGVRAVLGFALIAVGIVFCFLPGPGLLGVVFGLALFAGMSKTIARVMDRIEPRMRAGLDRAHAAWSRLSTGRRALLIGFGATLLALGSIVVWKNWIGPMMGYS